MLEEMMPHVGVMSRQAVQEAIRQELIKHVVAKTLPRSFASIQNRYEELFKVKDHNFPYAVANFILWINGERMEYTPVPASPTFRDPSVIIGFLPYDRYVMQYKQAIGTTVDVNIYPAQPGKVGALLSKDDAAKLLRKLDKNFNVCIHILYHGQNCKVMWIKEDGTCSIQVDRMGYQVRPLKEFFS